MRHGSPRANWAAFVFFAPLRAGFNFAIPLQRTTPLRGRCYGCNELAASCRTVIANTIQVANDFPAENYGFRPAPESRSVAGALMHLVTSLDGFNWMELAAAAAEEEKAPRTKEQIVQLLERTGEEFAARLASGTDEFLAQVVTFPPPVSPPSKTRFEMLLGAKEHEMHHRAQLMVVQRMLGITPHLTRRREEFIAAAKAAQAGR